MAAAQRTIRSLLNPAQQSKRTPITLKDDKYMQGGQLLLSVHQSPVPLERLLAVAKLAITFLTDLLRQSDDTQDIPVMVLGHHYLSHRQLGEGTAAIPGAHVAAGSSATAATPSAAGAATGAAVGTAAGSGTTYAAYFQEICTFDAQEGPKSFVGVEGAPLALLRLALDPLAIAKSKRLGRELAIKVQLGGGSSSLQLLEWGEEYGMAWPALQLLAPTSARCPVVFKGELAISCPASGLFMSLSFAKDHSVKGNIEQLASKAGSGSQTAAAAQGQSQAQAAAGAGSSVLQQGSGKSQVLGSVSGYWTSVINVSCPKLGLEGVLYDGTLLAPAPFPEVDLLALGPMRLPRVWSAIHDALLYADPKVASGGRAAIKLALTMSQYLKALTLDSAASRDVTTSATSARLLGGPSGPSSQALSAGRTGPSSVGALSSAALSSAGTDSDLEEFDRLVEGRGKETEDTRAVPPCYKAQHAAGNKLKYLLHYTLTSQPSSTTTTGS